MTAIRRGTVDGGNLVPEDVEKKMSDEIFPGVTEEKFDVFADMKASLTAEVEDHIVDLPVPARQTPKAIYVSYNCTFEYDQLNKWVKSAKSLRNKKETDPKRLALIVLHATCVGIGIDYGNDKRVPFEVEGSPQTFDSKAIQDMLGTMAGWSGAITTMYSNDGHMMQTMNRIISEAGYNEVDLEDADGYDPLG